VSGEVGVEADGRRRRRLVGLGLVLKEEPLTQEVRVEKVVEGGGASLSGQVLQGDLLVVVDDVSLRGLALAQILTLVRGQQGSTCVLTLSRKAVSSALLSLAHSRVSPPENVFRVALLRVATPYTVFSDPADPPSITHTSASHAVEQQENISGEHESISVEVHITLSRLAVGQQQQQQQQQRSAALRMLVQLLHLGPLRRCSFRQLAPPHLLIP
jgi:hypothetical protein